jgi:hypothetical protein
MLRVRTTSRAGIAVVLLSGALLTGCGAEGGPSASPAEERTIAVPADFPLTTDMRPDGPGTDRIGATPFAVGLDEMTVCGLEMKKFHGRSRLAANGIGPEYSEERELLSYGSVEDASAVLASLRDAVGDCPADEVGTWTRIPQEIGDDAVTLGLDIRGDDASEVVQLARVGRGVLLLHEFQADTGERAAQQAARLTRTTRTMLPDMCVFTSGGCTTGIPPHADGAPWIPDDFPLAVGMPTKPARNFIAPTRFGFGGGDLSFCSHEEVFTDPRDHVRVQYNGLNGETRTLSVYPDEAAAKAAMARLRSELASCPEETFSDRSGSTTTVANTLLALALDGDHVAWTNQIPMSSEAGNLALRRGAALLLVGALRDPQSSGPSLAERLTEVGRTLGDEMCLFTAVGC